MNDDDVFNLACRGEIDLHVTSSFDADSMPVFSAVLRFEGIEVAQDSEDLNEAILYAVWKVKEKLS